MWLTVYPCYWSYLFWFPFNKASTSHSHSAFQSKQRIVSFIIGFLVKNTTTCCLPPQLHVQIIAFKKCKEFLAIDGKKTSNCLLTIRAMHWVYLVFGMLFHCFVTLGWPALGFCSPGGLTVWNSPGVPILLFSLT